jgi:hypothetical protein
MGELSHAEFSQKGGASKTPRKLAAAKKNLQKAKQARAAKISCRARPRVLWC